MSCGDASKDTSRIAPPTALRSSAAALRRGRAEDDAAGGMDQVDGTPSSAQHAPKRLRPDPDNDTAGKGWGERGGRPHLSLGPAPPPAGERGDSFLAQRAGRAVPEGGTHSPVRRRAPVAPSGQQGKGTQQSAASAPGAERAPAPAAAGDGVRRGSRVRRRASDDWVDPWRELERAGRAVISER